MSTSSRVGLLHVGSMIPRAVTGTVRSINSSAKYGSPGGGVGSSLTPQTLRRTFTERRLCTPRESAKRERKAQSIMTNMVQTDLITQEISEPGDAVRASPPLPAPPRLPCPPRVCDHMPHHTDTRWAATGGALRPIQRGARVRSRPPSPAVVHRAGRLLRARDPLRQGRGLRRWESGRRGHQKAQGRQESQGSVLHGSWIRAAPPAIQCPKKILGPPRSGPAAALPP